MTVAPALVALVTHPACLGHDTGAFHPECPDRLRVVLRALNPFESLLRVAAHPLAPRSKCKVP